MSGRSELRLTMGLRIGKIVCIIVQVLEKTDGVETVSVGGHVRGVGGHNKSIHGVLLERFGVLPLLQLNRIK